MMVQMKAKAKTSFLGPAGALAALTGLFVVLAMCLLFRQISTSGSSPPAPNQKGLRVAPDPGEIGARADHDAEGGGGVGAPPDRPDGPAGVPEAEAHVDSSASILEAQLPYLIYGTAWKKSRTADLVSRALSAGFRFVDTACQPKHYDEKLVGEGWTSAARELGIRRDDLFLQTKFTAVRGQDPQTVPYDAGATLEEQVRQSVRVSLRNLRTDYIDSLVLHSPMKTMEETMTVWQVFEEFVASGEVVQLGISNCYDLRTFRALYDRSEVKPKVLQNRFYADSGFDVDLREFCAANGVTYQSFWTLSGNRRALGSAEWKEVAAGKGLTPQTLMYALVMTLGHTPLDGTTDAGHMEEDMELMRRMQAGERILDWGETERLSRMLGIPDR